MPAVYVGCAGWSISKVARELFPSTGSQLSRYSSVLRCVEINSSFYRPHRQTTYARWASETPDEFRFSVKTPKTITHDRRLRDCADLLQRFVEEISGLGNKLGVILVQLPPSLAFDRDLSSQFFRLLMELEAAVACEPRHASWFAPDVDSFLADHKVARVAADPAVVPEAFHPAGWPDLRYWRLHGSPRMYASAYDEAWLGSLAVEVGRAVESGQAGWCMFDNTMYGAAQTNAVALQKLLAAE